MPSHLGRSLVLAAAVAAAAGCVDRRYVVATNVPGAQVSVDGHPVGPAPVDGRYVYAGLYEFRATAPGYESLVVKENFKPKWYDYPGLDFFAEVVWPFRIEDVRYVTLELVPARPVKNEELQGRADELRAKAGTLPPPSIPDDDPADIRPPGAPPRTPTPRPPLPRTLPDQQLFGTPAQGR